MYKVFNPDYGNYKCARSFGIELRETTIENNLFFKIINIDNSYFYGYPCELHLQSLKNKTILKLSLATVKNEK